MQSDFVLNGTDSPSSLTFSNYSESAFTVTVEQPGLKAIKEVSLYSDGPDDSFVEFF